MNPVASGKRAVLVGLGKTGMSCAQHLARRGWTLAATDSRRDPPGAAQLRGLAPDAVLRCGGFDASLLGDADLLVVSPGVSLAEPIVQKARNLGIDVVGDIELFARAADAPVVGITGTNGKSTVTTLLGRMAERAGLKVQVGGNLGTPALDLLENAQAPQLYVLELSSFQLDSTASLSLLAAAVLNVTPDHMDRYATLQDYADSKARIYARCGTAVLNLDDAQVRAMPTGTALRLGFSLQMPSAAYCLSAGDGLQRALTRHGKALLTLKELRLSGLHNAANALASLALGEAVGLPLPEMVEELREFSGLAHRSQWVADIAGVRYVNDSKATNVGATLAAVAGISGPLILIAGGDGKGQDFSPLANAFTGKVRDAVLLGRDGVQLARALDGVCGLHLCATLDAAVAKAASLAQPGDTVLLSPACASLDMFRDYAQRGELFTAAVTRLTA